MGGYALSTSFRGAPSANPGAQLRTMDLEIPGRPSDAPE